MPEPLLGLCNRHQGPSLRIIWIELDGLLADACNRLIPLQVSESSSDPLLARHQIEPVSFGVRSAALFDRCLLLRKKFQLERLDDRVRDLILNLEDVSQIAIVAFSP